jgi:hypothetical protein
LPRRKISKKQGLPSIQGGVKVPDYFLDAVFAAGGNHVAPRRHDMTKLWQSEFV